MKPDQSAAEPGWLSGELNGSEGFFPEAYVEFVEEIAAASPVTSPQLVPVFRHFLSMKWQWTYGPILMPWNNHFHTSKACLNPL